MNRLLDIVAEITDDEVRGNYNVSGPLGVNGRNSDNTKIKQYLGWEPALPLRVGMQKTYAWICDQMTGTSQRGNSCVC